MSEPTTPPKEEPIVNFSDFSEFNDAQTVPVSEVIKKADEVVKQEEPKKVEEAAKTAELETKPKATETVVETPKATPEEEAKAKEVEVEEVAKDIRTGKKDYTDIDPADIPIFSKMGQKSFEKLKPIYLEHKRQQAELAEKNAAIEKLSKNALPDSYYQHPRGYTLSRDFEQAAEIYGKAQTIVNHWNNQLAKVEEGAETYQEIHIDQQGNFYLSKPVVADKNTVSDLKELVKGSEEQLRGRAVALRTLATSHSNIVKQSIDAIRDFEEKSFSHFGGDNKAKADPIVKDTISKILPPAFHNDPLATPFAKAVLTIQQLGELVKTLKAEKDKGGTTTTTVSTDQQKAGPTKASMSAAPAPSKNGEDITFDDFKEFAGRR